jgi:hypothetical protein
LALQLSFLFLVFLTNFVVAFWHYYSHQMLARFAHSPTKKVWWSRRSFKSQDLQRLLDVLLSPLKEGLVELNYAAAGKDPGARSQNNVRIVKVQPLLTGSLIMLLFGLCYQISNSSKKLSMKHIIFQNCFYLYNKLSKNDHFKQLPVQLKNYVASIISIGFIYNTNNRKAPKKK